MFRFRNLLIEILLTAMSHDVESELGFLARCEIYESVKPYSLRFDPPDSCPRQNIQIETKKVTIHDARGLQPTIAEHGFTLTSFPTKMKYQDLQEHSKIVGTYATELKNHLGLSFGAPHVRVIDYAVKDLHSVDLSPC